jgi:hypothetical protein
MDIELVAIRPHCAMAGWIEPDFVFEAGMNKCS